MWIFGALGAAVSFGAGDFLGGIASRRNGPATPVVLFSHVVGLGAAALLVPLFPVSWDARTLGFGAAAGAAGAVGLVLLYRGLAIGTMAVVAPVAAVGSAVLPLAYGLATGERPSPVAIAGALVAVASIWIVTATPGAPIRHALRQPGFAEATGAGVGFALFFILLRGTDASGGMVPLVAARFASIGLLTAVTVGLRRPMRLQPGARFTAIGAGTLDMAANALFLVSVRVGLLSMVAVLTSLYPVATVVLARLTVGERVPGHRIAGLAAAVVGIALIAAG